MCLVGVSTVYPLIFMALNRMRTTQAFEVNPFGLPTHFDLSNYRALENQVPFLASILHSFIVVIPQSASRPSSRRSRPSSSPKRPSASATGSSG